MLKIRTRLAGTAVLTLALASTAWAHNPWPPTDQPVQIVVTAPPGSVDDTIARLVAEQLGSRLGSRFMVSNQPGANGNAGASTVATSPADGSKLLFSSTGTLAINPSVFKELPFDPQKSFQAIGLIADIPNILVVNNALPANNLAQFNDYVKTHPGVINFGSTGNGSSMHLAGQLYMDDIGANMVHVPYSSAELATNDLVSGQIQSMFQLVPGALEQIRAGKVKALGIMAPERSDVLPQVPTMSEQGHPRLLSSNWLALLAPTGTPPDVIEHVNAALNSALDDPTVRQKLTDMGAVVLGGTPQDLDNMLASSLKKWHSVVSSADIRPH